MKTTFERNEMLFVNITGYRHLYQYLQFNCMSEKNTIIVFISIK